MSRGEQHHLHPVERERREALCRIQDDCDGGFHFDLWDLAAGLVIAACIVGFLLLLKTVL